MPDELYPSKFLAIFFNPIYPFFDQLDVFMESFLHDGLWKHKHFAFIKLLPTDFSGLLFTAKDGLLKFWFAEFFNELIFSFRG